MPDAALFTITGQEFTVTSPDRVLYPAAGTTKLDVIRYYAEASAAVLPQVQGRPATRKRWPEGVDKASFFVKDLEPGTPRGWPGCRSGMIRPEVLSRVRYARRAGLAGSGRRVGAARPAVAGGAAPLRLGTPNADRRVQSGQPVRHFPTGLIRIATNLSRASSGW